MIENPAIRGVKWPKQERGAKTFAHLLEAAQSILQETGIEALNSNAVAESAGVTTPVFYRYFDDKYALLAVLARRLTDAQNELYAASTDQSASTSRYNQTQFEEDSLRLLTDTYRVTAKFTGSRALLLALRALPELAPIRLRGNTEMANLGGSVLLKMRPEITSKDAIERARIAIEIGYSVIEMLIEVPSMSRKRVLERTNKAMMGVFFDD